MFYKILIRKKEIAKFKLSLKNPFILTCEKITQTPRTFNTKQIQSAIENIQITQTDGDNTLELIPQVISYFLKEFFLYLHQTGLYNRQLKSWETMANLTQASVSRLQEGFFKKKDLNAYVIDFFIDPKAPCLSVIIDENKECDFQSFRTLLFKVISVKNKKILKGIYYFISSKLKEDFKAQLQVLTNGFDSITKYESILPVDKNIRLNVLTYMEENEKYNFGHCYPEIRVQKNKELCLT